MPIFNYTAKDTAGKEVKGTLTAKNREDVNNQLRAKQMALLTVEEKATLFSGAARPKGKIKSDEQVIFTRQLSTMISAGIPLLESLQILQEQQENKYFKFVIADVVDRVQSGTDFSSALAEHPKAFQRIYVSMVKAGEAAGQLDIILTRLAEFLEATAKLLREIKSAMTYPVISLCMVLGITVFLLVGIIPKFEDIFKSLEIPLPGITLFILEVSRFLQNQWYIMIAAVAATYFGIKTYGKTEGGARTLDWVKLKMPIFGNLMQKVALSRFARTFATLIKSGVPILGSLEIVGATSGNRIVEEAIQACMRNVKQGETLAEPLANFWVFPPMVTRMIAIGERAGALESLLEKISEFYDQQVSATVDGLTALIEPLMIGVMGFLVGGIVLAVFLPIFKIQEKLATG